MKKIPDFIYEALSSVQPQEALSFIKIDNNKLWINDFYIEAGECVVVAAGKAACAMINFFLERGVKFKAGIVATNRPCKIDCKQIDFFHSSHPLYSSESLHAGKKLMELAKKYSSADFLFLISGGASSMVEYFDYGLNKVNTAVDFILKGGFDIRQLNAFRKSISLIKCGKLLRFINGRVISLIISDVVGDDISVIGSGLTAYEDRMYLSGEIEEIFRRFEIYPKSRCLSKEEFYSMNVSNLVIASNFTFLNKLKEILKDRGFNVISLGSRIEGDVECVAGVLGGVFKEAIENKLNVKKPIAIVFGGETTVKVKRAGKGGRNQHLSLLIASQLKDYAGKFEYIGFATDGKDGNSNFAGCIVNKDMYEAVRRLNIDFEEYIKSFNSAMFFERVGTAIGGFDTNTNVADVGVFVAQ